jgi:hypothetical protein
MSIIETLFAEMSAATDKFTALMASDYFLGTVEERDLDARINALARVIAVTPALTDADASVKLAAISRYSDDGPYDANYIQNCLDNEDAALIAGYLNDVRALAQKGKAEIIAPVA